MQVVKLGKNEKEREHHNISDITKEENVLFIFKFIAYIVPTDQRYRVTQHASNEIIYFEMQDGNVPAVRNRDTARSFSSSIFRLSTKAPLSIPAS